MADEAPVRTISPGPAGRPPGSRPPTTSPPTASSLAVAVVLALSATTIPVANLDSRPGGDFQLHTILLVGDLALLALVVTAAAGGLREAFATWRNHACTLGALALGPAMVPAALVHPSDRGGAALLRLAGAVAVGLGVAAARGDGRRLVVGTLAVVTLAHVMVAFAQRATGGPIGLRALGEARATEIGGRYASSGLTVHPYVLAAWCAVAGAALLAVADRRGVPRRLATLAGVAAFAGIGLTMSRAGLLAGLLGLAALGRSAFRGGGRRWRTPAAAAAALALGVVANVPGWVDRAGQGAGSVDAVSSGRGDLLRQAWGLLGDHLVTGVGPGRYVLALLERPELVGLSPQTPRPVHVTPLLLVVEGGLLVVPALLLLVAAVAWACWRGGAGAVALTLAMVPFLAFDHLAWSYPEGLVLTGLWLGVLDLLGRRDGPDPGPATATATAAATGPPPAPA